MFRWMPLHWPLAGRRQQTRLLGVGLTNTSLRPPDIAEFQD